MCQRIKGNAFQWLLYKKAELKCIPQTTLKSARSHSWWTLDLLQLPAGAAMLVKPHGRGDPGLKMPFLLLNRKHHLSQGLPSPSPAWGWLACGCQLHIVSIATPYFQVVATSAWCQPLPWQSQVQTQGPENSGPGMCGEVPLARLSESPPPLLRAGRVAWALRYLPSAFSPRKNVTLCLAVSWTLIRRHYDLGTKLFLHSFTIVTFDWVQPFCLSLRVSLFPGFSSGNPYPPHPYPKSRAQIATDSFMWVYSHSVSQLQNNSNPDLKQRLDPDLTLILTVTIGWILS
jgi:hypothetical protein